ncbi:diguanylate cyclase domain-containing protein [Roseomonas sp. GCM10028921]
MLSDAGEQLHNYARVMARRLDDGLAVWANDVRLLARFEPLEREPADPSAARRLLEDLQLRSPTFSWIGFAGLDGRVIAATGGLLEGMDVSARPWFRPGLAGLHLGDVHPAVLLAKLLPRSKGGGEGAYFVDAAAPVYSPEGRVLGVLAGHLTWRWVETVHAEVAALGPRHLAPVLRVLAADGTVLFGPEGEHAPAPPALQRSGEALWTKASMPNGPDVVLGFARTDDTSGGPHLGWSIVAQSDRQAVLSQLPLLGLSLVLGTLGISLLGGLLAAWNAGRSDTALRKVLGKGRAGALALRLEKLLDHTWRDHFTGLLSLSGFEAWLRARPELAEGCAVVALSCEGLQSNNECYGEATGEVVLREIGVWLQRSLRSDDAAVRKGDDGLLLCLPAPPDKAYYAARKVVARLELLLREGLPTPAGPFSPGLSVGIVLVPQHAPDVDYAISRAHAALCEAKRTREASTTERLSASVVVASSDEATRAEPLLAL